MPPYQPYYCEENALAAARELTGGEVWLITNADRQVAMLHQRAGSPVVWDYHVIVVSPDGIVIDPDCTLSAPVSAADYLDHCFLWVPEAAPFAPMFRVFDRSAYIDGFFSDRSHMLDEQGAYRAPPPPWPPHRPDEGSCLSDWLDLQKPTPGRWMTLTQRRHTLQERP